MFIYEIEIIEPDWIRLIAFVEDYEVEADRNANPGADDNKMYRYRERRYTGQQMDSWHAGLPPK